MGWQGGDDGLLHLFQPLPLRSLAAIAVVATMGTLLFLKQISTSPPSPHFAPSMDLLTVPGLRNMGNNCFLNVVLQALASSHSLLSFVASHVHGSTIPMPLATAVLTLLEELSVLNVKSQIASPRQVILALELYAGKFDFAVQQDAAEALLHLASAFRVELLECFKNREAYLQSLVDVLNIKAGNSCASTNIINQEETPSHSLHIWKKQLHWPMEGTMTSLLTCQDCGFQFSTQFELFDEVPLSPPWEADETVIGRCTVEDCLRLFTASERINDFRCSHCSHLAAIHALHLKAGISRDLIQRVKNCSCDDDCTCKTLLFQHGMAWRDVYSNAFKQLRVGCCPEVLCLNLQRAVPTGDGKLMKLMGHVSFPLLLNLFPFTIFAKSHSEFKSFSGRKSRIDVEHVSYKSTLGKQSAIIYGKDSIRHVMESSRASLVTDASVPDDVFKNSLNQTDETAQTSCNYVKKMVAYTEPSLPQHCDFQGRNLNHVANFQKVWLDRRNFSIQDCTDLHFSEKRPLCRRQGFSCAARSTFINSVSDASVMKDKEDKLGASRHSARCLYELISVVVHYGSPGSGHYTVYRKVKLATHVSGKPFSEKLFISRKSKKQCNKQFTDSTTAEHPTHKILHRDRHHSSDKQAVPFNGIENPKLLESVNEIFPSSVITSDDGLISLCEDEISIKISGIDNLKCTSDGIANTGLWFRVSDSLVEKVTEEEVFMAEATLLFYERCDEMEDSR